MTALVSVFLSTSFFEEIGSYQIFSPARSHCYTATIVVAALCPSIFSYAESNTYSC